MNLRAVIFDIYGTLLEIGPPPPDADARWESLWRKRLATSPCLNLAQFSAACDSLIARDHAAARARGIPYPEVVWPEIVCQVVPDLRSLAADAQHDFLFQQSQLWHTVRLPAEAASLLRALRSSAILLGIASNAQAYTVRELQEALAAQALDTVLFDPALCFWSYQHGFSKPDPHVFQTLAARLLARGIHPEETFMVGDRLDNDIEPTRAFGWRTWHLTTSPSEHDQPAGTWAQLASHLHHEPAIQPAPTTIHHL